jgi:predicted Zn-dependent peptidase
VKGVEMKHAEDAIEFELNKVRNELIDERELQKVKNKTESVMAFEDMSVMNRAGSLAFYELLGDGNLMNEEFKKYQEVTTADLQRIANDVLKDTNSNTIWYMAN